MRRSRLPSKPILLAKPSLLKLAETILAFAVQKNLTASQSNINVVAALESDDWQTFNERQRIRLDANGVETRKHRHRYYGIIPGDWT